MNVQAPEDALRLLREHIAMNNRAAASGSTAYISTSRHYSLLRYWFLACFQTGHTLAPDDVRDVAAHIATVCRSTSVKRRGRGHWWETILALVLPPGAESMVGPTVAAERWVQLPPRHHQFALEQLAALDPRLAKESVQRHWNTLSPSQQFFPLWTVRRAFSPDDDKFLESAAASKNANLRRIASETWCSVRGSSLAERLWADISSCFQLQGDAVVVVPPERHSPTMKTLGIDKRLAWPEMTAMESALVACLGHFPCAYWSDHLKMPASDLLGRMLASQVRGPYLGALEFSASQNRDVDWVRAFLDRKDDAIPAVYGPQSDEQLKTLNMQWYGDLEPALPPSVRESYVRRRPNALTQRWLDRFDDVPLFLWSKDFSEEVVRLAGFGIDLLFRTGHVPVPEEFFMEETLEPMTWHLAAGCDDVLDERARGWELIRLVVTELKQALGERDAIRAAFSL